MSSYQLTAEQITFYGENGYLQIDRITPSEEIEHASCTKVATEKQLLIWQAEMGRHDSIKQLYLS